MKSKILNLIKQAFSSVVDDDKSSYPKTQVNHNGKTTNVNRLSPYGLVSNPPKNCWGLLFSSSGQESNKFCLFSSTLNRKKELPEGVVGLYNELTGSLILLKDNGDVEITSSGDINLTTDNQINISGGNIILNGVDWDAHVHGGVEPGSSSTTGPQ